MSDSPDAILVTGAAGFIGMHVASRLVAAGHQVLGVDSLNPYYSVELKRERLRHLERLPQFSFRQLDLCDRVAVERLFAEREWRRVVHLAAQAGVRYAAEQPSAYVDSNLVGFTNIL
ncbi:MAG: SDR family NAD(P)-dependent oxidoreductase, partial [Planctomycetales bacterium]|nr:SDR family NAD(P)-dependent oxidoreductase [Planctomycetales bacterium]